MAGLNPYGVLGVCETATLRDIKKKYFNLLKLYHPDVAAPNLVQENTETTKKLNWAWEQIKKKCEVTPPPHFKFSSLFLSLFFLFFFVS
jgi:DnaJ-class molecular chaperone